MVGVGVEGSRGAGQGSRTRGTRARILVGLVLVALCAWGSFAGYEMVQNHDRSEGWRVRSIALQEQADGMHRLLKSRTTLLNQRIDQLDAIAEKLRRTRDALARSEGDVSSLEVRQRQLANEKAQVEDARAALRGVAANYATCEQDLIHVLQAVAAGDYLTAGTDVGYARESCGAAESGLSSYDATFG